MYAYKKQEEWVNHLSDESKIKIVPFDPSSEEKFKKIKTVLRSKLGGETKVEHRGASSFGISGQDEIDVYVPILTNEFDGHIAILTKLFGEPRSYYPFDRARFVTDIDGKHVDVFLINKEGAGWLDCVKFENHLRDYPESLDEYRRLKETGNGLGVREYY